MVIIMPTVPEIIKTVYPHRWYRIRYKHPGTGEELQGRLFSINCGSCGIDFVETDRYRSMSEVDLGRYLLIPGFCLISIIADDKNDIDYYDK